MFIIKLLNKTDIVWPECLLVLQETRCQLCHSGMISLLNHTTEIWLIILSILNKLRDQNCMKISVNLTEVRDKLITIYSL